MKMLQYRPNIELQKNRYLRNKAQDVLLRRRGGQSKENTITDNSSPWLPLGVQSLEDAIWISDQIAKDMEQWKVQPQS